MTTKSFSKYQRLITILLVAIMAIGGVVAGSGCSQGQLIEIEPPPSQDQINQIYVGGAVNVPGFYPLKAGDSLEAFIQTGDAKILSEPRIAVIVGKEATITTGDEVPYQTTQVVGNQIVLITEFKTVGVKLRVMPERIEGRRIQLHLEPEVSGISASTQTVVLSEGQTAELPIFYTRNAKTTVVVNDGEPFVIGGLLKEETGKTMRGIPLLSRIPFLGFFFRRTTYEVKKTNLIFYITPHIIKPEERFIVPKTLPETDIKKEKE